MLQAGESNARELDLVPHSSSTWDRGSSKARLKILIVLVIESIARVAERLSRIAFTEYVLRVSSIFSTLANWEGDAL